MKVNIIIKKADGKNYKLIDNTLIPMLKARKIVKEIDKTDIVKIYAKHFGRWHYHYKLLWEKK